jgi:aryl-alcohol dehydrogenase-like predicted oxidoreductase
VVRTLKVGDVEVTRIGLGTNRLSDTEQHVDFVRNAVAAGIQMIDTAYVYTGGESEAAIGRALAPFAPHVMAATKGGSGPDGARRGVMRAEIDESLRRLRADVIPLYYLHRVDPQTPIEESVGAIAEYVDAGKIRAVGLSNVEGEQIERARAVAPIAAVQNAYNLTDRTHDAVVDYCEREGIAFVAYYPLEKGDLPPAVAELAARREVTPAQVALAWLLKRSPVMLPIPGTLSLAHVRENLGALEIDLSDEGYAALL